MFFIRHVYERFPHVDPSPDLYIGPFPDRDLAIAHRDLYGPEKGVVMRTDQIEGPHDLMSPGEAVDYTLARY